MEFTLKKYSCSLCNKSETRLLLNKQGFNIVKCTHCGFVYVNPRVEDKQLFTIYQHSYFKNKDYGYDGYEQEKRLRIKNFERWLNVAADYTPETSTLYSLDIGCAAGYCMEVMKKRCWVAKGLELDDEMCEHLESNGFDYSRQSIEEFETGQKYSVITLFDVIEHIPNIDKAFGKLKSLLAADGIVIMVTPNHNSLQRKILGKRWFQYKPIEHVQYFDRNSLKAFADRNGLKMVHYTNCGQYADTQFLVNRLSYYHFTFLSKLLGKIFNLFRLGKRFFYTDTGSLFVIFKHQ